VLLMPITTACWRPASSRATAGRQVFLTGTTTPAAPPNGWFNLLGAGPGARRTTVAVPVRFR